MAFADRLRDALSVASTVRDWDDPFFDWQRAYIASVFSLAAYQHIPAFEIENADRAKLIPCEEYQTIYASRSFEAARRFLETQEEGVNFFVVVREYVVVVLAKIRTALFISLRGTQSLYDLFVDLDFRRVSFPAERGSLIRFHQGFFDAVASCFEEVVARAAERVKDDDTAIYITGHSLGGAMAAIMNAEMLAGFHWRSSARRHFSFGRFFPRACYAFGMPRYGNHYAVTHLAHPFHVYNERDLIPAVPPRFLGFADCPDEYCLTSDRKLLRPFNKGSGVFRLRGGKVKALGLAQHRMERYIERVESAYKHGLQ